MLQRDSGRPEFPKNRRIDLFSLRIPLARPDGWMRSTQYLQVWPDDSSHPADFGIMPQLGHGAFLLLPAIFQGFNSDIQPDLMAIFEAVTLSLLWLEEELCFRSFPPRGPKAADR